MENRRFQNPRPKVHGKRWRIRLWRDVMVGGEMVRKLVAEDLGPSTLSARVAARRALELVAPLNRGKVHVNANVLFSEFVEESYIPCDMPALASSTQERYHSVLNNYLLPKFADMTLGEMRLQVVQMYFSSFAGSKLSQESREKIWTVLSAIMSAAIRYGCIDSNPCRGVRLPAAKHGRVVKPHITDQQFHQLVEVMPEPYASMVYVSTLTGIRVSELAALRWNDVGESSLTIDERYCRGDLGAPKSDASNATIPVLPAVIQRIHRLKSLSVRIGGGRGGYQTFKLVKSEAPEAFVFQSVRKGVALRDNNILSRHIKPAARKLGIPWVNWRCLRTSFATLLKEKGVHVRDAQALLRHSKASTTLDIYQQTTDEHQRAAVGRLETISRMVN